uniref:Uncharacterized protein n=1 Tax=Quercus lobata TaxID=97700 RepID=A0A7N2N118_QUELO
MLGPTISYQEAKQEPIFLTMASIFLTLDPLGGSVMALTVQMFLDLLNLGARKFGIISVPPIGCCPSHGIYNATGGCLEELNNQARAFHATVDSLLRNLSKEFDGMKYSLGNTFEMTLSIIEDPLSFIYLISNVQLPVKILECASTTGAFIFA